MSAAAELNCMAPIPNPEFGVAFRNAPFGIAEMNSGGMLLALNPRMQEILENTSSGAAGIGLAELCSPEDRSQCRQFLAELFAGHRSSFQLESVLLTEVKASLRAYVWKASANLGCHRVLAIIDQCTESHCGMASRSRAERLQTMGRLAGGVAHDFNNLLTGVLLYCNLLLGAVGPKDRVRKYAEEIRSASLQASGLVRQLLAVVKPGAGEPRPLSLNDVVNGMRNLLAHLMGESIELEYRLENEIGLVRLDPSQAQQILLNLILNARDAMPQGGQIEVATKQCELQLLSNPEGRGTPSLRCVLLSICDNGVGMDEETRGRVFEPFFTTKEEKGTGLGLTTVHEIVSRSGGLIHVDSAPGRGTRFSILLPAVAGTPSQVEQPFPPAEAGHSVF